MATINYKTNLSTSTASFDKMIQRFGVVTVMNAKVYNPLDENLMEGMTAYDIVKTLESNATELCSLDTLKIANVTVEGPSKTITGGQYSNPLIKFGKTARLEMQDALGNANAISYLSGGIVESKADNIITALHNGEDFAGPKTIIGESFFIEQKSGAQVPVKIIFYQFLPDSLFNLTQDAEGDATVFDMNGDLLTTTIRVGNETGSGTIKHGVFYSIVDPTEDGESKFFTVEVDEQGVMTVTRKNNYELKVDGAEKATSKTITKGSAAVIEVILNNAVVYETTIVNK